jgi:hypothetical protein
MPGGIIRYAKQKNKQRLPKRKREYQGKSEEGPEIARSHPVLRKGDLREV